MRSGATGLEEAVVTPLELESRIKRLRNSLRRLLALHGLSWLVGVVLPLVMLAGLADWVIHLDVVIRAALLAALSGVALWLVYRRIVRPLFVRFDDLDIALRIEERWPGLHDRLASTIQFLRMDAGDLRVGSPALREATVRQAVAETSTIDFREVIEPKPVIKSLAAASSALLIATLLVMLAPQTVRIAMKRLFLPLAATAWPQRTHLVLDEGQTTLKVARGDSFTSGGESAQGRQDTGVCPGDIHLRGRRFRCRAAALAGRWRIPRQDRVGQSAVPVHGDRRGR